MFFGRLKLKNTLGNIKLKFSFFC